MRDKSFIYVISAPNGYVKIGWTQMPYERFGMLSSGSPLPLVLEYLCECSAAREIEAEIHKQLEAARRHYEWFEFNTEAAILLLRHAIAKRFRLESKLVERRKHARHTSKIFEIALFQQ